MQSQGVVPPAEPEVASFTTFVSTKGSCVDPWRQDLDTTALDKRGLYVDDNPFRLVALGRVYEGSKTVHNVPLGNDQVKVGVEEVQDANARVLIPNEEIWLVGQALNIFFTWPIHLV